MISTNKFNCSRKGLYRRLNLKPQLWSWSLYFIIMIQETEDGGLELTDPENDRKIIDEMFNENKTKLNYLISKQALRVSYIAILISIAAILLQLILILL